MIEYLQFQCRKCLRKVSSKQISIIHEPHSDDDDDDYEIISSIAIDRFPFESLSVCPICCMYSFANFRASLCMYMFVQGIVMNRIRKEEEEKREKKPSECNKCLVDFFFFFFFFFFYYSELLLPTNKDEATERKRKKTDSTHAL